MTSDFFVNHPHAGRFVTIEHDMEVLACDDFAAIAWPAGPQPRRPPRRSAQHGRAGARAAAQRVVELSYASALLAVTAAAARFVVLALS